MSSVLERFPLLILTYLLFNSYHNIRLPFFYVYFLFFYFPSHSLEYKTIENFIIEGILIFFQDYDVVWYFQCLEQCLTFIFIFAEL